MVVDDSPFMRKVIKETLSKDPSIEVVALARNGVEALEKLGPDIDVVTMDFEMPEMDGIASLCEIRRRQHPCRVLMVSAYTSAGAEITIRALREGAEDFVLKPMEFSDHAGELFQEDLRRKIQSLRRRRSLSSTGSSGHTAGRILNKAQQIDLVAFGASTGGPNALRAILTAIPKTFPVPIVIAQHMPHMFTSLLARDLSIAGGMEVVEGAPDLPLLAGRAILAPGGFNLMVSFRGAKMICRLEPSSSDPAVPSPSVDALFRSLAAQAQRILAVVLTGIGHDGTAGLRVLRDGGAVTLAQDEDSSVVYGMPRAAVEADAVDEIVPVDRMAPRILDYVLRR